MHAHTYVYVYGHTELLDLIYIHTAAPVLVVSASYMIGDGEELAFKHE